MNKIKASVLGIATLAGGAFIGDELNDVQVGSIEYDNQKEYEGRRTELVEKIKNGISADIHSEITQIASHEFRRMKKDGCRVEQKKGETVTQAIFRSMKDCNK
jgi:hypothetical protein